MKRSICLAATVAFTSGVALAGDGGTVNGVNVVERIFNDRPDSVLNVNNGYPAFVRFSESGFGPGGFANRHTAYLSNDLGSTSLDFDYGDAFDITTTVNHVGSSGVAVEAGIHSDLFGLGFFGQLPNGEIVSFGSVLPFHSFGVHPFAQSISLRIIHTPGSGDGVNPLPMDGTASTIEYLYDIGGGWVSSGPISMSSLEGGIPSNFNFFIGVGVQHNGAAEEGAFADTLFKDIVVRIPTPAATALLGLAGLVGLRRRR